MVVAEAEFVFGADHAARLDTADLGLFDHETAGQGATGQGHGDGLASGDIGRSADDGVDCGADIDFADGQAVGVFVGAAGLDATDDHAVEALAEVVDALVFEAGHGQALDQFGPIPGIIDVLFKPVAGDFHRCIRLELSGKPQVVV